MATGEQLYATGLGPAGRVPAERAVLVVVAMIAFAGLWFLLAPFYGPPGTLDTNRTDAQVRSGERGFCAPPLLAYMTAGSAVDATRAMACQTVGAGRWETGWMLLWTAAAGFAVARYSFRDERTPFD